MDLIQVDMIRPQASQAVFGGLANVRGLGALFAFGHLHAELGGDQDLVAPALQRASQEFLALPAAVNIGGVEKVDPGFDRGRNHGRRALGVDTPAEVVASEPGQGNLQ